MIYGLAPATFGPSIGVVPLAQLANALIKCGADINAIQEMRWIGQGCKIQEDSNINYMRRITNSRVRGWPEPSTRCVRFHPGEWRAGQNSHQGKVPQYKTDLRACPHRREGRCGRGCLQRELRVPVRQMLGPWHQDYPRGFQCQGWARRYLWSTRADLEGPTD